MWHCDDTVMTPCCSGRGFVESIFCCLWSSQWLNLLYNYAHYIQYMQVPLCDACDTVMTLWWLSVAHAEALHWRPCGLVESIFCCLWSSQWLNLLYNYTHYIQVPLCDACDTDDSGRGSSLTFMWTRGEHLLLFVKLSVIKLTLQLYTLYTVYTGHAVWCMWHCDDSMLLRQRTRGEHLLLFVKLSEISMRPSGCSVSSSEGASPTGDAWSSAPAQGCKDAVDHSVSSSWAPQSGKWPGSPAHSSCGWRRALPADTETSETQIDETHQTWRACSTCDPLQGFRDSLLISKIN